jgi:hypothetical protein
VTVCRTLEMLLRSGRIPKRMSFQRSFYVTLGEKPAGGPAEREH